MERNEPTNEPISMSPSAEFASEITIAIVDDDPKAPELMRRMLASLDCNVRTYNDAKVCLNALRDEPADIVIADLRMPGVDGFTILKTVKKDYPSTDVIIVTGYAEKNVALEALRLGAFDLIEKPFRPIELSETIRRTVRYRQVLQERDLMASQLSTISLTEAKRWGIKAFVGKSKAIRKILNDIRLLQNAAATSVLITGESGTGKELVARAIHFGSSKSSRPFVPVNSSAVPGELAESMLFGHVKGSFTGASANKQGAFDTANGGSLFLDEIGDMAPNVQTKLLRVIEDGLVVPVGGTQGHKVSVRIIAATNTDLHDKIDRKSFRSDLYYRLAAFTINLPSLRERKDDIPLLVDHFASHFASEMSMSKPSIPPDVIAFLQEYSFPGNVRELRNMIERALIETSGRQPSIENFHFPINQHNLSATNTSSDSLMHDLPLNLADLEKHAIRRAMDRTKGNVSAAARLLGISRSRLYRKLS